MKKSKRALRRVILSSLFDCLEGQYGVEWTRESFVNGQLSLPQIDALLAFKSDPRLEELRGALSRLEHGTFGECCCCKTAIDQTLLQKDPARRFCPECERRFIHRFDPTYANHAHTAS